MPARTSTDRHLRTQAYRRSHTARPAAGERTSRADGVGSPLRLARASWLDSVHLFSSVVLPTVAQGVVARRPGVVALVQLLRSDRRAIRLLRRLRDRYGADALALRLPRRTVVLALSADPVRRLLSGTPVPFSPATAEKRAALAHFQPDGVLISTGPQRAQRRAFNEQVLDTGAALHRLAGTVAEVSAQEMQAAALADAAGRLDWPAFAAAWWRVVRRIVLGDGARDDTVLIDQLTALRRDANWAYLRPRRDRRRRRFQQRLDAHLRRAEPGSLAGLIAATATEADTDPYGQVPHWLFAFDAAASTAFRTIALLSTHAEHRARVRAELRASSPAAFDLPYLRACAQDTVRLWPTTLAILRESTALTVWDGLSLPAGTTFLIHSPLANRDPQALAEPDRFQPELWLEPDDRARPPLVPFGAGPARCPGRDLVLLTVSAALAALLRHHDLRLFAATRLDPRLPLPETFAHDTIHFRLALISPEKRI